MVDPAPRSRGRAHLGDRIDLVERAYFHVAAFNGAARQPCAALGIPHGIRALMGGTSTKSAEAAAPKPGDVDARPGKTPILLPR